MWALLGAIVAALIAAVCVLSGGVALPAGVTLVNFLLVEALIGGTEALLYAGVAEFAGSKQAAAALKASEQPLHVAREASRVKEISQAELERQIKELQQQLAAHRSGAGGRGT